MDRLQRAEEPHRVRGLRRRAAVGHLGDVLRRSGREFLAPLRRDADPARFVPFEQGRHHRPDVADQRCGNGLVAVHFGGRDVDLDELDVRAPCRRVTMPKKPIQARTDEHHDIGPAQGQGPRRGCRLRVIVGKQPWPSTWADTARRWSRRTRGSDRRPARRRRPLPSTINGRSAPASRSIARSTACRSAGCGGAGSTSRHTVGAACVASRTSPRTAAGMSR